MAGVTTAVGDGAAAAEAAPMYAAMACAGAAAWLMSGRDDRGRRARLLLAGADRAAGPAPRLPLRTAELTAFLRAKLGGSATYAWWCAVGGVVLGLLTESWLPPVAGALAVPVVRGVLRRREHEKAKERRAAAVVELCGALSAELRAGRQPDRALLSAGGMALRELGDCGAAVLAAARFGGDVPAALREAARTPGAEGLRGVGACWQVAVEGGAGLAAGLDKVSDALRAERDQHEELKALLAGPRSTAAVLALLPLFGLLLGTAMGAAPAQVLLHSPPGLACLAAGGLLEWAGIAWVARLVRNAEAPVAAQREGRA